MAAITPSPGLYKVGSILLVFAIAILAIWAVNNFKFFGDITAKKNAA